MSADIDKVKAGARKTWAAGDFDRLADLIWPVGEVLVDAAAIEPGMDVLDVAAGTGNVATRAAANGAKVIAADLTPELFDAGRRRAEAAGVEIAEWIEADVEALPFEDASFDRVLSSFGAMFAPRHDVAANELVRVLRPGGTLVMSTWLTQGFAGRLFTTLGAHMPKPPDFVQSPVLWGDEGHARRLLGGRLLLAFEERTIDFVFPSLDDMLDLYDEHFGVFVMARNMLEADKYAALLDDFRAVAADFDAGEGETRIPAQYLVIVGHKPAE